MSNSRAIVLAAGKGSRLPTNTPKALVELGGQLLLAHVLKTLIQVVAHPPHIVVGHERERVQAAFSTADLQWHIQEQALGTAHAVDCALQDSAIDDTETVLITYSDMPLLTAQTYTAMLEASAHSDYVILTVRLDNPGGFGRIVRAADGALVSIVEKADCSEAQLQIDEVNVGVVAAKAGILRQLIAQVDNANAQKEYYLTDCVALALSKGFKVDSVEVAAPKEAMGINTSLDWSAAERVLQKDRAQELATQALVKDILRIDVRGEVSVGSGVVFDVGVILEGKVEIGDNVHIGPYTIIADTTIGSDCQIKAFSHIEGAQIGERCSLGPYARLRPDAALSSDVQIGNFVEVKKSQIAEHTKINHLSYIGDSEIGSKTNIGAGVITCNYDGAEKHKTVIGDDVFIGSDTQIIAPVSIGDGATIGAGSTISKDAESGALTLSRSEQKTIPNWQRPGKSEK